MEAASDPVLKAQCYTYCIANACVLQREGQSDIHVPLDEETKQTLLAATKFPPRQTAEPLKALTQRCRDFIEGASAELPFPDSLADEIVMAWRLRLDMDFQILFLDSLNGPEAEYMTPVAEWLRACAKESDTILKELPRPLKVAERLRKISMDFYIDGSPLFGWWDEVPDIIRAESYLHRPTRPEAEEAEKAPSTDWENAPRAVKDWDMKVVEKILDNAKRRYLTGTRQREESSRFKKRSTDNRKAVLKERDADIIARIIAERRKNPTVDNLKEIATRLSPEWASRYAGAYGFEVQQRDLQLAAAEAEPSVRALFPRHLIKADEFNLSVKSLGLTEEGLWLVRAWPSRWPMPAMPEGEAPLSRLAVYSPEDKPEDRRMISCALASGADWEWELKIPLSKSPELSKIKDEENIEELLDELLTRSANQLFLWVLGQKCENDNVEP